MEGIEEHFVKAEEFEVTTMQERAVGKAAKEWLWNRGRKRSFPWMKNLNVHQVGNKCASQLEYFKDMFNTLDADYIPWAVVMTIPFNVPSQHGWYSMNQTRVNDYITQYEDRHELSLITFNTRFVGDPTFD
jgi:hypothetical protein